VAVGAAVETAEAAVAVEAAVVLMMATLAIVSVINEVCKMGEGESLTPVVGGFWNIPVCLFLFNNTQLQQPKHQAEPEPNLQCGI
jgi:hypothetical protein